MFARGRNFRGVSASAAISLALVLCASPLAAQKTILTLAGGTITFNAPTAADYRFILRGSKGPLPDQEPAQLYARACVQGWPGTCRVQEH